MFDRNHRLSDDTDKLASAIQKEANSCFNTNYDKDEIIRIFLHFGEMRFRNVVAEMDEETRHTMRDKGLTALIESENNGQAETATE